mmetsp:Transcript_811/g.1931  ORF Transcript_811/g.1931 Transcript_811/m.1931 type:complete len:241 (-) Transcript_811:573-1295(-)
MCTLRGGGSAGGTRVRSLPNPLDQHQRFAQSCSAPQILCAFRIQYHTQLGHFDRAIRATHARPPSMTPPVTDSPLRKRFCPETIPQFATWVCPSHPIIDALHPLGLAALAAQYSGIGRTEHPGQYPMEATHVLSGQRTRPGGQCTCRAPYVVSGTKRERPLWESTIESWKAPLGSTSRKDLRISWRWTLTSALATSLTLGLGCGRGDIFWRVPSPTCVGSTSSSLRSESHRSTVPSRSTM